MSYEARVIYDFDSVSPEELGVKEGDSVTVVDSGVGQGWVMARARDGREGVVPEAYLERVGGAGDSEVRRVSATPSASAQSSSIQFIFLNNETRQLYSKSPGLCSKRPAGPMRLRIQKLVTIWSKKVSFPDTLNFPCKRAKSVILESN